MYLVLDNQIKRPLFSLEGLPYIQTKSRYIANRNNVLFLEICQKTINILRSMSDKVILTNNNNVGTVIDIALFEECYNEIKTEEKEKAKLLLYLILKCHLSIIEAEQFYFALYFFPDLYKEFKLYIFEGQFETLFSYNEKNIDEYASVYPVNQRYKAYFHMIKDIYNGNI